MANVQIGCGSHAVKSQREQSSSSGGGSSGAERQSSIKVLFKPKYWLVFQLPRALDISFPVALIRDLIMTDCSCEGFTEIVRSWLAGGSFFSPLLLSPFFFFFFLSLLGGARAEARQRQKGEKCWMAGVQELVTSCLIFVGQGRGGGLQVYMTGAVLQAPPTEISHCEWRKKESFKVSGSGGEERSSVLAINTLSFLCWLASQSPWRGFPGNKSDTHAIVRLHTHKHTHSTREGNAHGTAHVVGLWRRLLSPSPPFCSVWGPACSVFWTCWN